MDYLPRSSFEFMYGGYATILSLILLCLSSIVTSIWLLLKWNTNIPLILVKFSLHCLWASSIGPLLIIGVCLYIKYITKEDLKVTSWDNNGVKQTTVLKI